MLLSHDINQLNEDLVYLVQGLMVVVSVVVLTRKNPMISLFFLITFYVSFALLLHYFQLDLLGMLYILIYVGAISVLFIFILSLMNIKDYEVHYQRYSLDWFTISFTAGLSMYLFSHYNDPLFELRHPFKRMLYSLEDVTSVFGLSHYDYQLDTLELKTIGELLYTEYSMLFMVLGMILLFTIVSSIVLVFKLNRT